MNSNISSSKNKRRNNIPRRQRKNPSRESGTRRVLAHRGTRFSPPSNPPDTTAQPWYPLVLSTISKPGNYTFASLVTNFLAQLGKSTFNPSSFDSNTGSPFRVQIRLDKISVWNLTGRIVSLVITDLDDISVTSSQVTEIKDQLGSWVDCGGPSFFPSIGFEYPYSHKNKVFRPDPKWANIPIFTTSAADGDSILNHLHILWRSDGTPSFPTVRDPQLRVLSSLNSIAKTISDSQPSTLSNIIDKGGRLIKAASYVVPVATESLGTSSNVVSHFERGQQHQVQSSILHRLDDLEHKLNAVLNIDISFPESTDGGNSTQSINDDSCDHPAASNVNTEEQLL